MSKAPSVQDQTDQVNEALTMANALVTAVLKGAPDAHRKALDVARALDDLHRQGINWNKAKR